MRDLRIAVIAAVVSTLVFGLAYPLAMTGAAQVLFPDKADGDPTLIGTRLLQGRQPVPKPAVGHRIRR